MSKSSKGSAFEREVCKQLSLWWTEGQNDNVFWRTSQSGGRATSRAKKGKKDKYHHGDICAIDPIGQPLLDLITFELKRGYSRNTIQDLLDSPKGKCKYLEWIEKIEEQAASPFWLLIVQRDRRKALAMVPDDLWTSVTGMDGIFYCPNSYIETQDLGAVVVLPLVDFLKSIDPIDITSLPERRKCLLQKLNP